MRAAAAAKSLKEDLVSSDTFQYRGLFTYVSSKQLMLEVSTVDDSRRLRAWFVLRYDACAPRHLAANLKLYSMAR